MRRESGVADRLTRRNQAYDGAAASRQRPVSLPTVAVGVGRYAWRGAFGRAALAGTVAPMGAGSVGSVLGALLGGTLVPYAPQALLKGGLGVILNVSAWRIFRPGRGGPVSPAGGPSTATGDPAPVSP